MHATPAPTPHPPTPVPQPAPFKSQEDLSLVRPVLPEGMDLNNLPKNASVPHVMSAASVVSHHH